MTSETLGRVRSRDNRPVLRSETKRYWLVSLVESIPLTCGTLGTNDCQVSCLVLHTPGMSFSIYLFILGLSLSHFNMEFRSIVRHIAPGELRGRVVEPLIDVVHPPGKVLLTCSLITPWFVSDGARRDRDFRQCACVCQAPMVISVTEAAASGKDYQDILETSGTATTLTARYYSCNY